MVDSRGLESEISRQEDIGRLLDQVDDIKEFADFQRGRISLIGGLGLQDVISGRENLLGRIADSSGPSDLELVAAVRAALS